MDTVSNRMAKSILLVLCCLSLSTFGQIAEKDAPKLFKKSIIHEFRIEISGDPVPQLLRGMENYKADKGESYVKAEVLVDNVQYSTAGVRYKGQSSFDFTPGKKKSLKVEFDRFGDGKKHKGYKIVNLLNSFRDPTFLREMLYLDMLHAMGVPAPQAAYAKVYINDDYLGLYVMTEQVDDDFCDRAFGNDEGNLYKGQPRPHLVWEGSRRKNYKSAYTIKEQGSDEYYTDLVELIAAMDGPQGKNIPDYEYIMRLESVLNTQDMLKTWAVNNFTMNIDAYNMYYHHNFYLYNNPFTSKWEWINYDGNNAFGAWNAKYNMKELIELSATYSVIHKYPKSLQTKMFSIPYYKRLYLDQYFIMVQWFEYDEWEKQAMEYVKLIENAVFSDAEKSSSNEDFVKCRTNHKGDLLDPGAYIPGIFPFMRARYEAIKAELMREGYEFE